MEWPVGGGSKLIRPIRETTPGQGSFNAFSPSISASGSLYQVLAPETFTTVPVSINPTEWAQTPALGLMVVSEDNTSGESQGLLRG